jgi:O-Antigen ligase
LLLTTLLPFLPYVFPGLPDQFFGFNLTGWAWIIMLAITIFNLLIYRRLHFPILPWIPWIVFILGYIIVDFSFLGLQLTLQYILPLLVGMVASGFPYSIEKINWLGKWFKNLCIAVLLMFIYGQIYRGGYSPAAAAVPMLLSFAASLLAGLFFITKKKKYLIYFGILFLVPFIDVTRMGIAAFLAIFIFHFANRKISGKIVYSVFGLIAVILVFNSSGFQKKTFYGGKGNISDLGFDYYAKSDVNSSGRVSLRNALQPGLEEKPMLGNGPRADYQRLVTYTTVNTSEAHNDYLSVSYNYGYVGLSFLLFGFISNFVSIYTRLRRKDDAYLWLFYTTILTLFISFMMFMYSDNILKYTIYFPNYFFALTGILYSMIKKGYTESPVEEPDLSEIAV